MRKRTTHECGAKRSLPGGDARRTTKDIYVVILVGGRGKRLRPLSTDARPKAFISVTKDRKTMFRRTLDRAIKITASSNIIVAANARHEALVRKDFPGIRKHNLILEPVSRNTAPAVALAASILKKRCADAVMLVMHSDQYIIGEKEYLDSIRLGIDFTERRKGAIAIVGIRPVFASTELGYIKTHDAIRTTHDENICKVSRFVEKPDTETARKYLRSGDYLWNAGAFLFRPETILDSIKKHAPKIYDLAVRTAGIDDTYANMPDISIDHAVLEKASGIYCVMGSYRWYDLGSFENIREVLERESRDFVLKNGKIIKIL
jgi:mannose-1-phosphate guanylyltransferase